MFGISGTELFIILVFVLLIFGPDKLPAVGRTIGQMMREFKRAQQTMESLIKAEMAVAEKQKAEEGKAAEPEAAETASAEEAIEGGAEGATEDTGDTEAAIPGDVDEPDVEPTTAEEAGGWTPGVTEPDAAAQPEGGAEVEAEPSDTLPDEEKGEEEAL